MKNIDSLIRDLPDAESARRFLDQMGEKHPAGLSKLLKNEGLLSDILTLVAYSPLLATTLLQNPNYGWWLARRRADAKIRDKDELLESLARFSLTNTTVEPQILLARFRRRELLRIFLHDIRRLATVAETTEEISNLADAILEYALGLAKQELDNRYGIPLETDDKGRAGSAGFCVVSLGKLGSKELNYSSDIDLLFIYSADGKTSGQGTKGEVTNREYFVKFAEFVAKLVGQQAGEGAAYRVDLRLRPHGRIGALALSVKDTIRYYRTEARDWERQVLIRSRPSAGAAELYKKFFAEVEDFVFSKKENLLEKALENVRLSKEKIDLEKSTEKGFDVKLGRGGIREIEFIAQALQLAHGGRDEWLRVSHTLKSLARLADRRLLTEAELTELFEAYEFLRRIEHLLQMENGLQTHLVPDDAGRRRLLAKRLNCADPEEFQSALESHTANVSRIFTRIFSGPQRSGGAPRTAPQNISEPRPDEPDVPGPAAANSKFHDSASPAGIQPILWSLEKSDIELDLSGETLETLETLAAVSPPFAALLASNPALIRELPAAGDELAEKNYQAILLSGAASETGFARRLAGLRQKWSALLLETVVFDVFGKISRKKTKQLQTRLAEASLETALFITKAELEKRFSIAIDDFGFCVLGLGKLGGKGMDYGSDLDLILIYDDEKPLKKHELSHAEFFARAVEIFVTTLSAMTREGSLYRVDLRLRPDGKNGATSIGKRAFLDYLENRSAIWEWLAYIKLRAAGGDFGLADYVESEARKIIHRKALNAPLSELKSETRRIRERLETERAGSRSNKEIDIKFGAGGMLDVYFALRFLQLRDNIPDDAENRSTDFMLGKIYERGALSAEDHANFAAGYLFLTGLDHQLRLTVGRSTRLPAANQNALQVICRRMKLASTGELLEKLTLHRLNIRASFENILKD